MREDIKERIDMIKRGEVPEGYKRTQIGVIPIVWKVVMFSEVTEIQRGLVDPKNKLYSSMFHIGPENIEKNTGRIINVRTALEHGLISGKYEIDENTIVYSKIRPELNKVCIPGFTGICSADCYAIHVKAGIYKEYLYNYMLSDFFTKQAIAYSMRTKMPKINKEELSTIKVLLPSELEQIKIVEYLKKYNKLIDLQEKFIEEKRKLKNYLMRNLLTGKKRLKGFEKDWSKVKLFKIFDERIETNTKNCELLSITANGILPRSELEGKDNSSEDKSKYKKIYVGDIGYNTMRMWQGVSAYSNYEGIVSPAYTILKSKENIDTKFFSYLFKLPSTVFMFYRYSQGLVDDTRSLKYDNFKKIKLKIPTNIDEQKAISKILSTADKEIDLLEHKLEEIKLEKKAMMQLLLTGIVKVN